MISKLISLNYDKHMISGVLHDPKLIAVEYGPFVSALCRRMIRDQQKAEDAAQDAWIHILRALPTFQAKSKISTWIYQIVVRSLSDFFAQETQYSTKFLKGIFHEEAFISPYEQREKTAQWAREQCDRCLTGILHCLDTESRLIFIFREIAGLEWSEISEIVGISLIAIRQIGSRGKRRVRNFMDEECSLLNPQGSCRCRMAKVVKEINLPQEYESIRQTVDRLRLFKETENLLPRKNYWLNLAAH